MEKKDATSVWLHFSVKDSGIGIAQDKLGTIFESFKQADGTTTRKYGGTGLGLSISKQLVEKMGGKIWIESKLGKGSTFHFTARFGVVKNITDVSSVPENKDLTEKRVLIVDDNDHFRELMGDLLSKWKLFFVAVSDGQSALKALAESTLKKRPFDLVLMDAIMPGMDGFQTIEKIREDKNFDELSIIVLLSMGMEETREKVSALKISGKLLKPVKATELLNRLTTLFSTSEIKEFEKKEAFTAGPHKSLKIMLAEDNQINQMMATRMLEKLGHQVVVAQSGVDALKRVQVEDFDLILMDVQMPEMDGLEATQHIRKLDSDVKDIPIIAMTAYAMKGDQDKCIAAGMNDYIPKPIEPDRLLKTLARWCEVIGP